MINKILDLEKKEFHKLSSEEKFKFALAIQHFTPYVGGKENPKAADCSGAVSLALMTAFDMKIRVTADYFYKKVFTEKPNGIDAMFLIVKKPTKHFGRVVPVGTATHIVGFLDNGIVLDEAPPRARIRTMQYVANYAKQQGKDVAIKGVNLEALKKLDGVAWGLDKELQ